MIEPSAEIKSWIHTLMNYGEERRDYQILFALSPSELSEVLSLLQIAFYKGMISNMNRNERGEFLARHPEWERLT